MKMKIRKEIIGVALIGFTAICMDCHPSQKSMDTAQINVDTSISEQPLLETHWTVIELNGKRLTDTTLHKEMYLVLKKENNRAEGEGACNSFSTTYTLKNKEIVFGPVVSTKIFCQAIDAENQFFKALSATTHFVLKSDTLTFLEGKALPVAKFISH